MQDVESVTQDSAQLPESLSRAVREPAWGHVGVVVAGKAE